MEVDYEPLTEGGSMRGPEPQQAEASFISASNSGENAFPPKTIQEDCLPLCRPTRYDGRRDVEALEEFLNSLDLSLRLQNAPEDFQLLLASSLFIPASAREQAMAELRNLKQGKLSVERYVEKYQSLVNGSPMVAAELHYQWFMAGLEPVVRQTVTGWATDREMRDEKVELADMMKYLRRMEKKNATPTALAEKEESGPGNNPDLEPMDIGAVNTKPAKHGARSGYHGRQDTRTGKTMGVKRSISSKTGHIPMSRDFYVGPVHHDIILGMPWVTQWKAQMSSSDGAIEVIPPGSDERVHLSALPTAFASSMV
ncbi:uncharacterized protein EMH_0039200 [Eimeria mitis]|uniref:Retrotransposon gag domain-containing protein n=1 Tax=Eimeria mitis TaxID=44415 RepID=U6JXK2_9EIME|nr:uncharacterized protein EMH_0039200 [Eimeria mitis]CDJ28248.1 hypothetical protein EMH_0039200 [Eimeria mitis]